MHVLKNVFCAGITVITSWELFLRLISGEQNEFYKWFALGFVIILTGLIWGGIWYIKWLRRKIDELEKQMKNIA